MAAPTPQEAAMDARCFTCLSDKQLNGMIAYMLGQILLQSDSMADVTPAAMAEASRCFSCLSGKQLISIQTYLLTQIFNNGGGGGGGSGEKQVWFGSGPPSGVQTGMNPAIANIYYDENPGGFDYRWNVAAQSWY